MVPYGERSSCQALFSLLYKYLTVPHYLTSEETEVGEPLFRL
jgi:hypothetical protein